MMVHAAVTVRQSLSLMAVRLECLGFKVYNIGYACRKLSVCESAESLAPVLERLAGTGRVMHLAGHSMGGLVIRRLLSIYRPANLGRVVTMGTPHLGSPLATRLHQWRFYQWLFGPAGHDLITGLPLDWAGSWPPPYDLGLIAGNVAIGPGMFIISGPSDGTVAAVSSQPPGAADYAAVRASHTIIPFLKRTAVITANFFKTGRFA
jgi:pimeloyl-ACP methyl ester carboxylesterase